MPSSSSSPQTDPHPGPLNYIAGFLLVGLAWGLTTPFIRRAAKTHTPPPHPSLERARAAASSASASWALGPRLRAALLAAWFGVADLLRNPRYAVPLLLNLTGSVWFFLLIGKAELSLTVPIVNTLAFLFTVVGEWWVEKKVISKVPAFLFSIYWESVFR
ncbi:uncharacterized protein E0L32_002242 [Thyridium curvatum]|uniref:Integral membrane protein n=1 Tax=Thyridium curvatum TaxID=1093900 RepID=A0A507AKC4_9PEZI|nr:uncharacterized protein E0L32_002242 [Thyridium curvatum]TPX06746.1 hypothetical protein E0L32_002242 [Thyridium curvatum]